jgi:Raf kinase inhibitor-like YbhB/YbcL family protein
MCIANFIVYISKRIQSQKNFTSPKKGTNMKTIFVLLTVALFGTLSAQTFTLKSSDLGGQATDKQFGSSFGCSGKNISPELHWENAPKGTKCFAVTMYDKDAPTGSGFWHWVVYNIPASVSELPSDAGNFSQKKLPEGAENGANDAGAPGYVGPCPPPGENHMYLITVYALKEKINVDKNATAAIVGFMLNMNTLEKASIVMYGKRPE